MKLFIKNAGDGSVVVLAGHPDEQPRLAACIAVGETRELEVPPKHVLLFGDQDLATMYLPPATAPPLDLDFSKET